MRYIVVGSGIAGITAARIIRENEPDSNITVLGNEIHPLGLYARKDMPRHMAQALGAAEDLLIDSKANLARMGIDLQYEEVVRAFVRHDQVLIRHAIRHDYDRLLLAVGATPRVVDVPGIHYVGVHQLRNYDDAQFVENWIPLLQQAGVVIIGAGLLGLDMAWALRRRGVPVTLVAREGHVGGPTLDAVAAAVVESRLVADGVTLYLNDTVTEFLSEDNANLDAVQLSSGAVIPARMALNAIGVRPSTDFLEDSGLEVDEETGGIPVNDYLQTSFAKVYAAGNCALAPGGRLAFNWALSAEQGRIAALNMIGRQVRYQPALWGDLNSRIYDLPLAYFGQRSGIIWDWDDGANGRARIYRDNDHITGAVLVGTAASAGRTLFESAQAPVTADELEGLFSTVAIY